MYLTIIKTIWQAHSKYFQWQKLKAFSLSSRIRQGSSLLPSLMNTVLEVITKAIRQKSKQHPNCKESKTACRQCDIRYRKPWRFHQKTVKLINSVKLQYTEYTKLFHFCTLTIRNYESNPIYNCIKERNTQEKFK